MRRTNHEELIKGIPVDCRFPGGWYRRYGFYTREENDFAIIAVKGTSMSIFANFQDIRVSAADEAKAKPDLPPPHFGGIGSGDDVGAKSPFSDLQIVSEGMLVDLLVNKEWKLAVGRYRCSYKEPGSSSPTHTHVVVEIERSPRCFVSETFPIHLVRPNVSAENA